MFNLCFCFVCVGTEASTTQPESSSEEEEGGPSSHGVASESSDSEDEQGTVNDLSISEGIEILNEQHVYERRMYIKVVSQLEKLRKESLVKNSGLNCI